VAREPFDHTSTLRFLERLTGVRVPNLSDWRRSAFGDLTSALGVPSKARPPRLQGTKRRLEDAVRDVATLPAPAFPEADQTPPRQEMGPRPRPRGRTGR
jgi:phospholipase C